MKKNFNIILELVTWDFLKKVSELLTRIIKKTQMSELLPRKNKNFWLTDSKQ